MLFVYTDNCLSVIYHYKLSQTASSVPGVSGTMLETCAQYALEASGGGDKSGIQYIYIFDWKTSVVT